MIAGMPALPVENMRAYRIQGTMPGLTSVKIQWENLGSVVVSKRGVLAQPCRWHTNNEAILKSCRRVYNKLQIVRRILNHIIIKNK